MNNGFIVLWRKFKDTSFYDDSYAVHLSIELLLRANHKNKKIIFNGEEIEIKRGQCICGRKSLFKDTKIKPSTIRNKLSLLKKIGFLDISSNNKFSIITILNYNTYQNLPTEQKKQDSKQDNKIDEKSQSEKYDTASRTANWTANWTAKQRLKNEIIGQQTGQQIGQQEDSKQDTNNNINNHDNKVINNTIVAKNATIEARDYFYNKYKEKTSVPYVADFAKDGKIFKDILKVIEIEPLKELINKFFNSEDEFIIKAGWTTGVFRTQVNKIHTQGKFRSQAEIRKEFGLAPE